VSFLERQLGTHAAVARLKRWFYAGLAVIAVSEIVLPLLFHGSEEPHFSFESFPAFGSVYGLISCVAIIIVSKLIGKAFLMRREDHYER
jgi:hypothetical protein